MLWPKVYTIKRYDYHSNPIKGWQNFFQLFVDSGAGLHWHLVTCPPVSPVYLVTWCRAGFQILDTLCSLDLWQDCNIPRCQVWTLYEALNVIPAKSITLWHHQVGYFISPVMFIYLKWVIFLQIWRTRESASVQSKLVWI